jgi:hypothetical protein
MVDISTRTIDPRRRSETRRRIEQQQKILTAEDKAFKAQTKMIDAVHDYGQALAALLELGQSKTAVAKAFGMSTKKLTNLINESRGTQEESTPPENTHPVETSGDQSPATY